MTQHCLNRPALYDAILFEFSELLSVRGVSSVVRLDSEDRIIGKPAHINLSALKTLQHLALWRRTIKAGNNPILCSMLLHLDQCDDPVGIVTGAELLESINYYKNTAFRNKIFDILSKSQNIEGMGYYWLRLTHGFIWVICLRRKVGEGPFSARQRASLQQIGFAILGSLESWYIPAFDILDASCKVLQDKLTERQYETLYHLGCYCSRKECAEKMGVRSSTIDRNIENLLAIFRENFEAFEGKTIAQIIRRLKGMPLQSC